MVRCFIKYKSIFEIGQGNCVEFPVLILNQPDKDNLVDNPIDLRYKVVGQTVLFDHNENLGDCFF